MRFLEIQTRLLARVRLLIRNGELTERGFARISGISQPHIHKVLKGTRTLSAPRFDFILRTLDFTLLDLFDEDELRNHLAWECRHHPACTELPIHECPLGPGQQWSAERITQEQYPVPCTLFSSAGRLALVRLAPDPEMAALLGACNLAVLELTSHPAIEPGRLYAVDRGKDTVLRWVRPGAHVLYLVSDENRNEPLRWETVPKRDECGRAPVRGSVQWLSEQKWRKSFPRQPRYELAATSSYVSRT